MATRNITVDFGDYTQEDVMKTSLVLGYEDMMDGETMEVDVLDENGQPTGQKTLEVERVPNTQTREEFIEMNLKTAGLNMVINANADFIDKEAMKQKRAMEKLVKEKLNTGVLPKV